MSDFITLSDAQRKTIFTQAAAKTGLPSSAIEKDWWVTQLLRIVFSLPYASSFVFKGGTSLSKGYNLINRFSEDIDLAIDRGYFQFDGELSRTQIKNLRKKSANFISNQLLNDVHVIITTEQLPITSIGVEPYKDSDTDPLRIYVTYEPLTQKIEYLPPRVLLEISCRSLREPFEERPIKAIIDNEFNNSTFTRDAFPVQTVLPQRTFLEKIFLLHEEWQKRNIRVERLTRHLYDIERLMNTPFAQEALQNSDLFYNIVNHRKSFNPIRGVNYENHKPENLRILPPDTIITAYKTDYQEMQESMFAGESLSWDNLIKQLVALQEQINNLIW